MSNLNENLRIVSVREMMVERLAIPNYQRPYRWGTQSALRLITNTLMPRTMFLFLWYRL